MFWDTTRSFRFKEGKNGGEGWQLYVVKQCFKLWPRGSFAELWFCEVLEKSLLL